MVDFKRALAELGELREKYGGKGAEEIVARLRDARDIQLFKQEGAEIMKGEAKQLFTLWETKKEGMLSCEVEVDILDNLVKAAKVGGFPCVKMLAFKNITPSGKKVLNVLADPCLRYVKGEGAAKPGEKKQTASW